VPSNVSIVCKYFKLLCGEHCLVCLVCYGQ